MEDDYSRLYRIAGLSGIFVGGFILTAKDVISKALDRTALSPAETNSIVLLLILLPFFVVSLAFLTRLKPPPPTPVMVGAIAAFALASVFIAYQGLSNSIPGPTKVSNATGQSQPVDKPAAEKPTTAAEPKLRIKTVDVCHGERKARCEKHPFTIWEECSAANGVRGADPNVSCANLCGKPFGSSCQVARRPGTVAESGNRCGYSWFTVSCFQ